MTAPIIQPYRPQEPPQPGHEWECQCARCGSSVWWDECDDCGGEGVWGHDCGEDCCACAEPEDNMRCDICRGHGGWHECLSSADWCRANPLPGREEVERGMIEWFQTKEDGG